MSLISENNLAHNKPRRSSSHLSKLRKLLSTLKTGKSILFETVDIDTPPLSHDSFKTNGSEWIINTLKNNIRRQIIGSVLCLKKPESWLTSIEKDEIPDLQTISKPEANNAFLWAAFLGKFDLMTVLESHGADISYANEDENFNALHLCALNGSLECCKWLKEKECPVLQTFDGLTPMHYAVFGNSYQVLEFLINGCCIPDTVIHSAVRANAVECVRLLLSSSVDVNSYFEGMTPLHIAVDLGYTECIYELFKDPYIDVNLRTEPRKYTALHFAAKNGDVDCMKWLLEKQAKIGEVNLNQETALHLACQMSRLECVEILLKNGVSVHKVDKNSKTPLHAALAGKQPSMDVVKLLVDSNAEINVADCHGYTPLHLAAINELEECATYLIQNGANAAAETKNGLTPLNMMCRKIPGSVPAIWKRFSQCLTYDSNEQSLRFDFQELVTNSKVGETGFLYELQKEGLEEMLSHPLCKAFLHLKWQKLKWYYYLHVLLLLMTVGLLSYVVLTNPDNNKDTYEDNRKGMSSSPNILRKAETWCDMMLFTWYMLGIMVVLNIIRRLNCIVAYNSIKDYLSDLLNFVELLLTLTIISLFLEDVGSRAYEERRLTATAAVLLSWIYLTLTIGQLPYFATYITMFKKVLKEMLKLLFVYFCLLFGFTITFDVIFPAKKQFDNLITAFVHTLAMMTGELNLNDITAPEVMTPKLFKSMDAHRNQTDAFDYNRVAVYSVLVLFIVLVTMALMNLLIGIAVSDVERLRKTAVVSRLVDQTRLMYFLELSFFHGFIPKKLTGGMKKRVFVYRPNSRKAAEIHVKPLNKQEKRLPKYVMVEARKIALERRKQNDEEDAGIAGISSRIGALEVKMSAMYDILTKLNSAN